MFDAITKADESDDGSDPSSEVVQSLQAIAAEVEEKLSNAELQVLCAPGNSLM